MDIVVDQADYQSQRGRVHAFPAKMALREGNDLLGDLPAEDRAAVMAVAQPFDFELGHIFCEPGSRTVCVDFIESGIVSAVAVMEDGRTIESHMVGREGATHPLAYQATTRCYTRLVGQAPGRGLRIDAARLRALADKRPAIRDALAGYAVRVINELEQSTACNALHTAERRFAKWLLRCHDRVEGDQLNLTQEFLASMLGAQRTTVNEAAQHLQKLGAIHYSRGKIRIVDRIALEAAACECYGVHCQTLDENTVRHAHG